MKRSLKIDTSAHSFHKPFTENRIFVSVFSVNLFTENRTPCPIFQCLVIIESSVQSVNEPFIENSTSLYREAQSSLKTVQAANDGMICYSTEPHLTLIYYITTVLFLVNSFL